MGSGGGRGATQQTQQAPPEVVPYKAVEDGVDAAVQVGQADGEGHGRVDDIQRGAVFQHLQLGQKVHEVEHLMGSPAQEEGQHRRP